MTRERYIATIAVVDESGRVYELQQFVTIVDGREGSPFYHLPDGIPARRVGEDEFEIGMVDKIRVKRLRAADPDPSAKPRSGGR